MTSLTTNQQTIHDIFGTHLGRQADTGGLNYWSAQLDAGKSVADVIRGIQSGSEYKNRSALTSSNPDITEAQLDQMVLPGGWKTEHYTGYDRSDDGDLFDFNRGNTWKGGTGGFGTDWAKAQNAVNSALGATAANNYSTAAGANTGNYEVGVTHDATGNPITTNTDTNTDTATTNTNNQGYLTSADLTSWWEGLDKPWLNQSSNTSTSTGGGMDDFMKFMMFMSMMRPQGGGYGGSQYGYGGMNPGGVQSAYNPVDNMQGMMDAFRSINTINTGKTT